MGPQAIKTFGVEGGTIGRADGNNWILPDSARFLSSQHALISYQDNQFSITDLSSNGLFINDASKPLGNGNTTPLNQVRTLFLGEYSIDVSINIESNQQPQYDPFFDNSLTEGLLSDNLESDALLSSNHSPSNEILLSDNIAHDPMDLLNSAEEQNTPNHFDLPVDLFGDDEANQFNEEQIQNEFSVTPKINDAFIPPNAVTHSIPDNNAGIPENWDKTSFSAIPIPAPAQPSATTPPTESVPSRNSRAQNTELENCREINNDPFSVDILDSAPSAPRTPTTERLETEQKAKNKHTFNTNLIGDTPLSEDPDFFYDQTLISPNEPKTAELSELFEKPQPTTSVHHDQQASNYARDNLEANQSTPSPSDVHLHQTHTKRDANQFKIAKATFRAKDLDPALLSDPDFVDQAVALLPYFLDGTLDTLRSRANIKNELRASKTILQSIENNPLKFSVNLQDAIQNLIINQRPGFLNPTDSVQQAFKDLAQHEAALISGIQAGLNGLLKKMNPETIETKIESLEGKKNLFGQVSSSKKWNFYKETYQHILENSSDSFIDMFGNDFVKAYESHINNQKRNGK